MQATNSSNDLVVWYFAKLRFSFFFFLVHFCFGFSLNFNPEVPGVGLGKLLIQSKFLLNLDTFDKSSVGFLCQKAIYSETLSPRGEKPVNYVSLVN